MSDGPDPQLAADEVSAVDRLLTDRPVLVVSNREPYSHEYENGSVEVSRPAGGLTAALDPVMASIGGTWIAWGSGDADAAVVDGNDRVAVPPGDPTYDLRRVWLTEDAVDGYYYGYANRVLWPLAHSLPSKMNYDEEYWSWYRDVNEQFAGTVVDEAAGDAVIWFHDYHFGLAPRMVRRRLDGDALLAHFWHIPWPPWDVFRRCPDDRELLDALLNNDVIGFHTTHDRQQFAACAEKILDATYDPTSGTIIYDGRRTYLRSAPIQIDAEAVTDRARSSDADAYWRSLAREHGLDDVRVALGVDRLDYTKGIEQRLDALETFFERYPEWQGELVYVQKASESRSDIAEYRALQRSVEERIATINDRFGTGEWRPIVYLTGVIPPAELAGLYRNADLALVSPRRDGLNIVAKEYVASQIDADGVLVLSDMAGVTEELDDSALTVDPAHTTSFAETIERALALPDAERRRRMEALQELVASTDTRDWITRLFQPLTG